MEGERFNVERSNQPLGKQVERRKLAAEGNPFREMLDQSSSELAKYVKEVLSPEAQERFLFEVLPHISIEDLNYERDEDSVESMKEMIDEFAELEDKSRRKGVANELRRAFQS